MLSELVWNWEVFVDSILKFVNYSIMFKMFHSLDFDLNRFLRCGKKLSEINSLGWIHRPLLVIPSQRVKCLDLLNKVTWFALDTHTASFTSQSQKLKVKESAQYQYLSKCYGMQAVKAFQGGGSDLKSYSLTYSF